MLLMGFTVLQLHPPNWSRLTFLFLRTPPSFSNRAFMKESQVEIACDTEEMAENDTDEEGTPPSAAKKDKDLFG